MCFDRPGPAARVYQDVEGALRHASAPVGALRTSTTLGEPDMHTIRTRPRLLLAIGALALSGTACSSIGEGIAERAAEEIAEQAAGEGVEIDLDEDGGTFRIESSEGTLDFGGGEIPDGFPDGLPLPDGHEVLTTMSQGSDDGETMMVNLGAPGGFDAVRAAVESGLDGWTIDNTSDMSSGDFASTTWTVSRDDWSGSVTVSSDGSDQTTVAYVLERSAG